MSTQKGFFRLNNKPQIHKKSDTFDRSVYTKRLEQFSCAGLVKIGCAMKNTLRVTQYHCITYELHNTHEIGKTIHLVKIKTNKIINKPRPHMTTDVYILL